MKFNLAEINQIKKLHHMGMDYADIVEKLKLPQKFKLNKTLIYYYIRKAADILYHNRKVGRPRGSFKKVASYGGYNNLIDSLPCDSYYRSMLIKKLEKDKKKEI